MLLSQLLDQALPSGYDRELSGITLDSRKAQRGFLFLACRGTQVHGEIFIEAALRNGAAAILRETDETGQQLLAGDVPCVNVPRLSEQVGALAARFFQQPTQDMRVIGVTGTNGKTSVTHFIAQALQTRAECGLIGTIGYGCYGALIPSLYTTPDAVALQSIFAQFHADHIRQVVMEVSSHALDQGRVNGIRFTTAVLTNITHDHLDYHKTMEAYAAAKQRLFHMEGLEHAVINLDDPWGQHFFAELPPQLTRIGYSIEDNHADVYAQLLEQDDQGCQLRLYTPWGEGELHCPLYGRFNISNLLAACACLLLSGFSFDNVMRLLSHVRPVAGRMERFGASQQATVIIDYAHTPDALEKALTALRDHCSGQLWCVFGCGGDRDRTKRPVMGDIAKRYADRVIVTDDNPRHEASAAIINDILAAWTEHDTQPTVIANREQAIRHAVQYATADDVILVAGKGHEDYQLIGDQRLPFSDRALVATLLT